MFYKEIEGVIHSGENIISLGINILAIDKDSYTYPVDGWYWFDTVEEANAFFMPAYINPDTLAATKTAKLTELRADYTAATTYVIGEVSMLEVDTYTIQEKQAKEYKANPAATTVFLDNLAYKRGISKDILVDKILIKAAMYEVAGAILLGALHAKEDAVRAATTINEVNNIIWEFPVELLQ